MKSDVSNNACIFYTVLSDGEARSAWTVIEVFEEKCVIDYYIATSRGNVTVVLIVASRTTSGARVTKAFLEGIAEGLSRSKIIKQHKIACGNPLNHAPLPPSGYSGFNGESVVVLPGFVLDGLFNSLLNNERVSGISELILEYMGRSLGLEYSRIIRGNGGYRVSSALRYVLSHLESTGLALIKKFRSTGESVLVEVVSRSVSRNSRFMLACVLKGIVSGLIEGVGFKPTVKLLSKESSSRILLLVKWVSG